MSSVVLPFSQYSAVPLDSRQYERIGHTLRKPFEFPICAEIPDPARSIRDHPARKIFGACVHHGYGLLSCVQITAYNFHLGLLRPEPFWLDTAKSTRSVVRPTSL